MIKTWTIAILLTALAVLGSLHYNMEMSYDKTLTRYDVVLDELMVTVDEQHQDIVTYIGNERMLLEEIGGLADALEYVMDGCATPKIEDTL